VSGPIASHLGLVAGGSWRRLVHVPTGSRSVAAEHVSSLFANVVRTGPTRSGGRVFGWVQQAGTPTASDRAVHVQSSWTGGGASLKWRVFGGWTERRRADGTGSTLTVDRLVSDPITDVVDTGAGVTRLWTIGLRASSSRALPTVDVVGVAKRERSLLGVVDVGLPSSAFAAFQVPDPSFRTGSPIGAPTVTVYARPSATYGRDAYVLTNQTGMPATFAGLEFSARVSTARLVVLAAATASRAVGPAAGIGYLATEDDVNLLGDLLVDPNSGVNARGRVFGDRAYTAKVAAVYRGPWRTIIGATARYQDGQPFARLVVTPDAAQGATAVRAYPNGATRFTYTGTLDLRLQYALIAAPRAPAAVLAVPASFGGASITMSASVSPRVQAWRRAGCV
jgi:hypothetical protein